MKNKNHLPCLLDKHTPIYYYNENDFLRCKCKYCNKEIDIFNSIADIKINKKEIKWTSNFTPPTQNIK